MKRAEEFRYKLKDKKMPRKHFEQKREMVRYMWYKSHTDGGVKDRVYRERNDSEIIEETGPGKR